MNSSRVHYLLGQRHSEWSYPDSHLAFITPDIIAEKVIALANEVFSLHDKILWDMFAGIGTDSVRFARVSGRVIATEINSETFEHLQKNSETVDNLQVFNQNCTELLNNVACDVVYFDPPWGCTFHSGQQFDFTDVAIDMPSTTSKDINVVELAKLMQQRCHLIIKSPFLSDSFERVFSKDDIISIHAFPNQKLKFLLIRSHCDGL